MAIEFSDDDKVSGSWIKWDVIGKKVQGTLIGRRQKANDLKEGEMQWIYELLSEDGEILIIGGRPGLDPQLSHVRLGQIVEIRYMGDKPSVKPGYSATKLLQVYTNRTAMDKNWLAMNPEHATEEELASMPVGQQVAPAQAPVNTAQNTDGEIKVEDIPFNEPTTTPVQAADPNIAKINELARVKLGVVSEDQMEINRVVMETTGLAMILSNHPAIIAKLEAIQ